MNLFSSFLVSQQRAGTKSERGQTDSLSWSVHCPLVRTFFWEVISTTRASCVIRGSKHLETIKTRGRFISFSMCGTSDEILALVVKFIWITKIIWCCFIPQMTYADITFFNLCNIFAGGKLTVPEQLSKFPLLVEHYNRVLNVPQIKAWVEKRPETDH